MDHMNSKIIRLKNILNEIIEILVIATLREFDYSDNNKFKYKIVKYKAFNKIIKPENKIKSIYYDLYIYDCKDNKNNINKLITNKLNKITYSDVFIVYRYYIYNLLSKNNLIDNSNKNYYIYDQLFDYDNNRNSILIRLLSGNKILKFPVVRFINRCEYKKTSYSRIDDIYYETFENIYNNSKYNIKSNIDRKTNNYIINKLNDYNNYNCEFISQLQREKMKKDNIKRSTDIENIYRDIRKNQKQILQKCENNIILDNSYITNDFYSGPESDSEFVYTYTPLGKMSKYFIISNNITNKDINNILNKCKNDYIYRDIKKKYKIENLVVYCIFSNLNKVLERKDSKKYIYNYSGNLFRIVNKFLQYKYLGMKNSDIHNNIGESDIIVASMVDNIQITRRNMIPFLNDIVTNMSNVILNTRESKEYNNNLKYLQDEFYVYRVQSYILFDSIDGDIFKPENLRSGDMIFIPYFQSTSYSKYYHSEAYLHNNSFVFRIKINKHNKKWVLIGNYTPYSDIKELLIDRNVVYKVINTSYKTIKFTNGNYRDIMVIDVELVDNSLFDPNNKRNIRFYDTSFDNRDYDNRDYSRLYRTVNRMDKKYKFTNN